MPIHQDTLSSYVLAMGLAIVMLLVWLVHRQRTGQGFTLWLASGLVGMLLGSAVSYAAISASGYVVTKPVKAPETPAGIAPAMPGVPAGNAAGPPGMGPGGGIGGMGGGMGRGPSPKRDLSTLVRKLNLLTDDIALKLSSDQSTALVKGLSGVDEAETFSDDDAKKMYDELFAILGDDQKTKLDAIQVPFGGRGPGGPGGPGGGGMGGGPTDPNANPFRQENNLKALKSFRDRFSGTPSAEQ